MSVERWRVIPRLVLPRTSSIDALGAFLGAQMSVGFDAVAIGTSIVGSEPLDPFAVAGALADEAGIARLAVACVVGEGRQASVMARELTTLDHLRPGGTGLVLLGRDATRLGEAEAVVTALLEGGPATVAGTAEHVADAPNLPPPPCDGGPPLVVIDLSSSPPQAHGRFPGTGRPTSWRLVVGEEASAPSWGETDVSTVVLGGDLEATTLDLR